MTWFRVDDNLTFHPKAVAAGNTALGLWVRAGSWSAFQLTDGRVPEDIALSIGTRVQADRLVKAGLWVPNGSGWMFHEWEERQPTKADVLARRKAGAERLREWRKRRDEHDE